MERLTEEDKKEIKSLATQIAQASAFSGAAIEHVCESVTKLVLDTKKIGQIKGIEKQCPLLEKKRNNVNKIELRNLDHKLKMYPKFFDAFKRGIKPFEVRKKDRNYKVGDLVGLFEYHPHYGFSSGYGVVEILYILNNPDYVKEGYLIFAHEQKYIGSYPKIRGKHTFE